MSTPSRRPTPAGRATRRSRRPAPRSSTFLERNRNRLLVAGGAVAVLILAGMAFLNSTQPAYACSNTFDPTAPPRVVLPTAEPGTTNPPATEPPIGFVQADMGHNHVDAGTRVTYTFCPPASGKHYNEPPLGPIPGNKVYGPSDVTIPQGWIHNLEHSALVLLYKCPGPACDDAGQAALKALLAKWPNSPVCDFPPNQTSPVITRFDDMAWPYAALVWDNVLPMQTLDEASLLRFFAERAERFNVQELACPLPTPTPGPATPTPAATATQVPTTAPTIAPTTVPTAPASTGPSPS
ncbi:MAG: DUF3105 domain-containing protein [Chloroflexi bacterium]|nr:DUF3105 domain-containing protein [Chloroflexota bacterium]